jgi:hypothetical protein
LSLVRDFLSSCAFSNQRNPFLGEEYFVNKGANALLYFGALILTGQIEQAIKVLASADALIHAVHTAILAYQLKMLILTDTISSEILTCDVHDKTVCQLNFARLVLLYVKNFELSNVNYALNYCFFLNKLELDESVDDKGSNKIQKVLNVSHQF